MRQLIYIIILFFVTEANGQNELIIPISTAREYRISFDTQTFFRQQLKLLKQLKLDNLKSRENKYSYRLLNATQAIDVWTFDHNQYFGTLTNYASRCKDNKSFEIKKIYSNKIKIDSLVARQIFTIIDTLTEYYDSLKNSIVFFPVGLDGQELLLESSSFKKYDFRIFYWSKEMFTDTRLKNVVGLKPLITYLYDNFNIDKYYETLKLPHKATLIRQGFNGVKIGVLSKDGYD
jgi:hypothetical protein